MEEGTRVLDREDDDPDEAVLVGLPEETTIADWEYEVDGETYTTAESNPDYPADDQLALISFVDQLDEQWPDWETCPDGKLLVGVRDNDVPRYGFPVSRLEPIDDGEATVPEEFEDITDRLEENGFEVALEESEAELHAEKYGMEYVIEADGSVEGDDGLLNRVTSIVSRYL